MVLFSRAGARGSRAISFELIAEPPVEPAARFAGRARVRSQLVSAGRGIGCGPVGDNSDSGNRMAPETTDSDRWVTAPAGPGVAPRERGRYAPAEGRRRAPACGG